MNTICVLRTKDTWIKVCNNIFSEENVVHYVYVYIYIYIYNCLMNNFLCGSFFSCQGCDVRNNWWCERLILGGNIILESKSIWLLDFNNSQFGI